MFSDTITITIDEAPKVLNRINQDGYSSEYFLREVTGEYRLRIRNSSYLAKDRGSVRVDRHNVELVQMLYPVSPSTVPMVRKMYTIIENDQGDTITDPTDLAVGLVAFHTEGNIIKLMNWES